MNIQMLAAAYADAVMDYLECGVAQGIVFKDGGYALAGRRECATRPHLWVDKNWQVLAPGITAPIDPRHPEFDEHLLRRQIIGNLAVSRGTLGFDLVTDLSTTVPELAHQHFQQSSSNAQISAQAA